MISQLDFRYEYCIELSLSTSIGIYYYVSYHHEKQVKCNNSPLKCTKSLFANFSHTEKGYRLCDSPSLYGRNVIPKVLPYEPN